MKRVRRCGTAALGCVIARVAAHWEGESPREPPPKAGKNHNGYTRGELSRIWFDWGLHDQKIIDLDTVEWCERAMDTPQKKPRFLAAGIFKPHLPFYADAETFKKYPFEDTVLPKMPRNDLGDVPIMTSKDEDLYFLNPDGTENQKFEGKAMSNISWSPLP